MSEVTEPNVREGFVQTLMLNGSKYENVQEARSILAVYEQQLFVWHSRDSCVLTVEFVEGDVNQSRDFNVLLPTNPPVFEVECLSFNRMGTLLALVGNKGVMIMQVPWMSRVQNSRSPVFCRSWHIAERFFVCSNRVNVLQALWHPGSLNCSHIVVLSTDNYLRLYDATDSQIPIQAVQLGSGDNLLSTRYKVSFSACLGESAVSFDFGPPESTLHTSKLNCTEDEELLWPIYVLHANGDIYVLRMSLKKTIQSSVKVEGPLAMYPPAEDNYGVDACSLICLHSNPPVLVIAMASGIIYHCLLLESALNGSLDEDSKLPDRWLLHNVNSDEPEVALYVHGSIELSVSPTEDFSDAYCQPVRLYKDVTSYSKYYCSLLYGVHAVVMPFIQKLEGCVEKDNIEGILAELQHNDTIVEHLLCSKPLSTVKAVPVIGVTPAVTDKGVVLMCLLASWEFTCLPLLASFQPEVAPVLSSTQNLNEVDTNKVHHENFGQQIQHLLCRSTNTPVLKAHAAASNSDTTNSQQCLELLWNSTNRFREEYIDRLCTAHSLIEHRVNVLIQHKHQQLLELEKHLKEKEKLRNKTEQLAEKYEDAHATQQLLFERIEKVMKLLQQRFPVLSTAEIGMKHDLIAIEQKMKGFQLSLEQLKEKLNQQNKMFKQQDYCKDVDSVQSKMESMNLGETQLKHVKEILHQEGESIAKLVRTVVSLEKETGL